VALDILIDQVLTIFFMTLIMLMDVANIIMPPDDSKNLHDDCIFHMLLQIFSLNFGSGSTRQRAFEEKYFRKSYQYANNVNDMRPRRDRVMLCRILTFRAISKSIMCLSLDRVVSVPCPCCLYERRK